MATNYLPMTDEDKAIRLSVHARLTNNSNADITMLEGHAFWVGVMDADIMFSLERGMSIGRTALHKQVAMQFLGLMDPNF